MRIVVVSDTHRDFRALYDLVQRQKARTDLFLHLGDGEREVEDLLALEPDLPLRYVRGNCDLAGTAPLEAVVMAEDVKIYMTHGHECGVKYSLDTLETEARCLNAQIALYGHTHTALYTYRDGVHIMNPGSLSQPRGGSKAGYGVIEVRGGQILCNLAHL